MTRSVHTIRGRILGKAENTEKSWRLEVFSPENGGIIAHFRKPGKRSPALAPPDLFDEVTLATEAAGHARHHFVRECQIERRLPEVARSYHALREASLFGQTIWRNLDHLEFFPPLYELLEQALAAFARVVRPEVTHFKSLYLFAKLEGYPVKEDMIARWSPADREIAQALLRNPLDGELPDAEVAHQLLDRMRRYLREHSDILIAE
jgi:hypothetical protein